ncbi:MAG: hypothetical protein JKX73_01665 [Flavobacteriales bacterium]|nr:hypothetical protein [Flavobacteriales bacterium]
MKTPWLWLLLWSVLIHAILIALSIAEVAVYAFAIEPGHDEAFYTQHAQLTAPWVSIIGGLFIFFLVARKLARNRIEQRKIIGLVLPALYIVLDLLILNLSESDLGGQYVIFAISFSSKILASYVGATSVKSET